VLADSETQLLDVDAVNRRGKQIRVAMRFAPLASNGDEVRGAIVMMEETNG
jgi:hypothetical protein